MTDLEELKARNPIQAVAESYGVVLQRSGDNLRGLCPFHDDHDPSLYIDPARGTFKCFGAGCGLRGDIIDFVGHQLFGRGWHNRDTEQFKAALTALEGHPNSRSTSSPPAPPQDVTASLKREALEKKERTPQVLAALDLAARVYHEKLLSLGDGEGTPLRYLYKRAFTPETVRNGRLGYCPPHSQLLEPAAEIMGLPFEVLLEAGVLRETRDDQGHYEPLYGRVTITDRDYSFRVIHLIGRLFPGDNPPTEAPKYLVLSGWPKPLYGLESLAYRAKGPVFVVEAPLDMLTLRQWGHDAVAVVGADLKRDHAERLGGLKRPLVIVPNNDPAGHAAAERWQEAIQADKLPRILHLPPEIGGAPIKDVNELAGIKEGQAIFADLARRLPPTGR